MLLTAPSDSFVPTWVKPVALVDIVFSAVADTVCLPYTIPKSISEGRKKKSSNSSVEDIGASAHNKIKEKT